MTTSAAQTRPVDSEPEQLPGRALVVDMIRRRGAVLLPIAAAITASLILRGARASTWPALAYTTAVCTVLAAIDFRHRRLPDVLTTGSYPVLAALLLIPAIADHAMTAWTRAMTAGAVVLIVFLALALFCSLGAGDARLAALLAMLTGWHSWVLVFFGVWVGFAASALIGLGMLLARRTGWRVPNLPGGPGLMFGGYVALLLAGAR